MENTVAENVRQKMATGSLLYLRQENEMGWWHES